MSFGKQYDKEGAYIRRYVPALKDFPSKYIYEPWLAPLDVQKKANCVLGIDYPNRICIHEEAKARCMSGMRAAYENRRGAAVTEETEESAEQAPKRQSSASKKATTTKKQKR